MRYLLAMLLLTVAGLGAYAEPVAMVVHLTGHAKVVRGGTELPARLLLRLEPKDRIRSAAGSEVGIVMVTGGKRFLLAGDQTGTVTDGGVDGAKPMAGLRGPSLEAANKLAGTKAGVNFARPPTSEPVDLVTDFEGWLPAGTRRFRWNTKKLFGIDTGNGGRPPSACRFSLFDRFGSLIWSARTTTSEVEYPADMPPLETSVPYVWRLDGYGDDGKPFKGRLPWGIVSLLDEEQATHLKAQTADLQKQIAEEPMDPVPRVLLADTYRRFGDLMFAIKQIEKLPATGETGGLATDLYAEAGNLALLLSGTAVPAQNPDSGVK